MIEVWVHAPSAFWRQAQEFTDKVRRRVRADRLKAVSAVRRARKSGPPPGVDAEAFERERERLATYISSKGRPLVAGRRAAHAALMSVRSA